MWDRCFSFSFPALYQNKCARGLYCRALVHLFKTINHWEVLNRFGNFTFGKSSCVKNRGRGNGGGGCDQSPSIYILGGNPIKKWALNDGRGRHQIIKLAPDIHAFWYYVVTKSWFSIGHPDLLVFLPRLIMSWTCFRRFIVNRLQPPGTLVRSTLCLVYVILTPLV